MSNVTNLPAAVTEDGLFGIIDDARIRCLSCETIVHVTDRQRDDEGCDHSTLYCYRCDVEDILIH